MRNASQPVTGQALVADFQTAIVSAATVEAAQFEATRSENELLEQLQAMSSGTYLNPGSIAELNQDSFTRASLDAHIKKVQTEQLNAMGTQQLQNLVEKDRSLYGGRKVTVSVLANAENPIDIVWFDPQNGYRTSACKKKSVTGVIEDVLLDRNLIILKPNWGLKLLNGRIQNYLVYIVDPTSFRPMVSLTIN